MLARILCASKNRMDWSCAASGMVGTRDDPELNESATSLTTYISCFDGGSPEAMYIQSTG